MKTESIIYALAILILLSGAVLIHFEYWFIGGVTQGVSLGAAYWAGVKHNENH